MKQNLIALAILTVIGLFGFTSAENFSSTWQTEDVKPIELIVTDLSGNVLSGELPESISGDQRASISGSIEGLLINSIITYFYRNVGLQMVQDVFIDGTGNIVYTPLTYVPTTGCQWNYQDVMQTFMPTYNLFNREDKANQCIIERKELNPDPVPVRTYVHTERTTKILETRRYNSSIRNGFGVGYCTWYAAIISPEIFSAANIRGNAIQRCASAREQGLTVSDTPSVGAIIVYGKLTSSAGHVGKVIDYMPEENNIIIKEMNYVGKFIANTRLETTLNPSIKCYISL